MKKISVPELQIDQSSPALFTTAQAKEACREVDAALEPQMVQHTLQEQASIEFAKEFVCI